MKRALVTACCALVLLGCGPKTADFDPTEYVVTTMGSTAGGCTLPMVSRPFGMVQLCPDTSTRGTGYNYRHDSLFGFSHMHKSGSGGGSDFEDILFLPVSGSGWAEVEQLEHYRKTPFSHDDETTVPGYYSVSLPEFGVKAELTATKRCGLHRYTFPKDSLSSVLVDLKFGNVNNCTIVKEDQYDTVKVARLEVVDGRTIRGCRISNGWCPEMHVYFYARFSKPFKAVRFFDSCSYVPGLKELEGLDVRALVDFGEDDGNPLEIAVGISPVDMEGAEKNLRAEVGRRPFDKVAAQTHDEWVRELSRLEVNDPDTESGRALYTCYYFTLLYPMLYNDVDGRFRGSDRQVHEAAFDYYAGVLGLWDIFRAHLPLTTVMHPEISSDLMNTMLEHYRHCGLLPMWVLAGQETSCMEGYHSAPVVADAYRKGVRGFDAEEMFEALKVSASRDTFGFFCRNYRGATNYLDYHYVPCDLEVSACSKTLEYCYDDWCIAQMARMLGHEDDEKKYLGQSLWYRNIFDSGTGLMRGKDSEGNFRTPFDPFFSNHNLPGDDFMEGTAWQWTFHVMHDIDGLMELCGGKEAFTAKLDSLFYVLGDEVHGENKSGDITGLVGHYAHGNEPSHHVIYLYNLVDRAHTTQELVTKVIHELYSTRPDGLCGNDDTGQMSAWYVWNSLGIYPFTHGDGRYMVGAPQHERMVLHHANGTLTVEAPGVSRENCHVRSLSVDGKAWEKPWLTHEDIFDGDVTLHFEMYGNL